jgi:hypothetical protein
MNVNPSGAVSALSQSETGTNQSMTKLIGSATHAIYAGFSIPKEVR